MAKKFKLPPIEKLATVDTADSQYGNSLVEITGVVSLAGQGGWGHSDGYEVHCFEFAAWRATDNSLIERPLTILRPVRNSAEAFEDFEEASVHRVQVLLSANQMRAVFAKSIGSIADADLEEIGRRLKETVIVITDRFGPLTLDRRINWFNGQAIWNGQDVAISTEPDEDKGLSSQLQTAEGLFGNSTKWDELIRQFAVQEKLDLANDWQEEEVTAEEFLERMTLESISIKPDGRFEFWHDDGDLFWGHSIRISGSLKDGLTHADIQG